METRRAPRPTPVPECTPATRRIGCWIYVGAATGLTVLLTSLNLRLYSVAAADYAPPGVGPDVLAQLRFIRRDLEGDGGERMQRLFPEGYFFGHALYGDTWVNVARLAPENQELQRQAIDEVRWVLDRLEGLTALAPFHQPTQVPNGVFYTGWYNRLLGRLLNLQSAADRCPTDVERFHTTSAALAQAFHQSSTYHLDAYPGQCWPVDNIVALTSLRLHDDLSDTDYASVIDEWLAYTQEHLDPETGLIPHKVDAATGQVIQEARGSSQVLLLSFLSDLDPRFARQQYARFRSQYVQPVLGWLVVREYPRGVQGPADVDSGPLVFGISPVATGVSIAAARANGDQELFERVVLLSEVIGFPRSWQGEKDYLFGQLMVGDAFIVWGKTIVSRHTHAEPDTLQWPPLTSSWWRLQWHLFSVLAAGFLLWPLWFPAVKMRLKRQA
jgi:hypothetical protein